MKKKITLVATSVLLVAAMVIGGTLAYFTSTDYATNVMTLGNVAIKQTEEERAYDAEGKFYTLRDFTQDQALYPMVDNRQPGDVLTVPAVVNVAGDTETKVFNNLENAIDKFISVTNTGTQDAYVRTILAFETAKVYEAGTDKVIGDAHDKYFLVNGTFDYLKDDETGNFVTIKIDGTEYCLAVCVYENAIGPEERTPTSLRQIGMTWDADNEAYSLFGNTYEILALSQATQTTGFTDAQAALNEAFGVVDAENAKEWFEAIS